MPRATVYRQYYRQSLAPLTSLYSSLGSAADTLNPTIPVIAVVRYVNLFSEPQT
jgi:hypothetical protein